MSLDHIAQGFREVNRPYARDLAERIDEIRRMAKKNLLEQQANQRMQFNEKIIQGPLQAIYKLPPGSWIKIRKHDTPPGMNKKFVSKFKGPFKLISMKWK